MAKLIEVTPEMRLPAIRLALVISGANSPPDSFFDNGSSRTFYASKSAADIAFTVQRASLWADEWTIPNVYLKRE
jgi:hypothetical protein